MININKIFDKNLVLGWRELINRDITIALCPKITSGCIYPEFFPMDNYPFVINLGCGLAPQAITYNGQYRFMIGLDICNSKLLFAKKVGVFYNLPIVFICGNVEALPFRRNTCDVVLAIDLIEHVEYTDVFIHESFRILKPGGKLLVTFPALIDRWKHILLWFAPQLRKIGIRIPNSPSASRQRFLTPFHQDRIQVKPSGRKTLFNPDSHKHEKKARQWIQEIEQHGFQLASCRATTIFPPFHVLGIPKFWYTSHLVSRLDKKISKSNLFKFCGQSVLCLFIKS